MGMTDTTETIQPADLLRLAFCPQCDYSLRGLPEEGICPECSRKYDQTFIILRGKLPGTNSPALIVCIIVGMVLVPIILSILHPGAIRDPALLLIVAFGVLPLVVMLTLWSSGARPGEILVWLSPTGVGQQGSVDPGSPLNAIYRWLMYRSTPVAMLPAIIPLRHDAVLFASMIGFVIVFWIGMILIAKYAGKPSMAVPSDGIRPGLFAWRTFNELRLIPLGKNRYRLRARYTSWVRRWDVINIVIEATDATAVQLRALIAQWGGVLVQYPDVM